MNMKIALKTPEEIRLLEHPNVKAAIAMFGLDTSANSSLPAYLSLKKSHQAQTHLATISGSKPPPEPDFSQFAPLTKTSELRLAEMIREHQLSSLPPGYSLDQAGKRIFDTEWKSKGIHCTELPPDHPDYAPF
jgi:hypothetical protein